MKRLALIACLAGCVDGVAPGQPGIGRRVDVMRGPIVAAVPPITDLDGDVFVVTGVPDADGVPQPGNVYVGGARGGWSTGCPTGTGPDGAALGWIGAIDDRAWLWTHDALLQIDAGGTCTTQLDTDPRSGGDLRFEAVAPFVERTISTSYAVAVVTTKTDPKSFLVTIDLLVGKILSSTPIDGGGHALGAGAGAGTGAFLIGSTGSAALVLASPTAGLTAQIDVAGTPAALRGELGLGDDGSIAAVLADGSVLVGDRGGVRVTPSPVAASGIARDDAGGLWLTASGPKLVPVTGGQLGAPIAWTSAAAADAAIAAGVDVLDERNGGRTGTRWHAHNVLGDATLIGAHPSLPYAVGVRGWLIGDAPVDRGGISYSDVAFVPLGVSFP